MTTETQALTPVARAQVQLSESAQHDVDGFKAMKFAAQLMAQLPLHDRAQVRASG